MMSNLNWVQTIDLKLLICGSDVLTYKKCTKKISISWNTFSILLNLQRDSL
jgi:hypothetical protein